MNLKETRVLLAEILHPANSTLSYDLSALPPSDWDQIIELANNHLVVTSLYPQLKQKTLTGNVPNEVADYFSAIHQLNSERNESILQQLDAVLSTLSTAGVVPVLLKGSASLSSQLYPDPGMRFLGDIDILVAPCQQPLAIQVLQESGYQFHAEYALHYYDSHHHFPALLHHDYVAAIEVHKHVTEAKCQQLIPVDKAIEQVVPVDRGQQAYMFNATYRFLHNLIHTCLQDENFDLHGFSLRQVYEAAMIMHHHGASIDWLALESLFEEAKLREVFYSYLGLVDNLFHIAPDESVIPRDRLCEYSHFYDPERLSVRRLVLMELKGKYSSVRKQPKNLARLFSKSWYKSRSARIVARVRR